jgi:hypothetical protein
VSVFWPTPYYVDLTDQGQKIMCSTKQMMENHKRELKTLKEMGVFQITGNNKHRYAQNKLIMFAVYLVFQYVIIECTVRKITKN